jgi:hypothetical protein
MSNAQGDIRGLPIALWVGQALRLAARTVCAFSRSRFAFAPAAVVGGILTCTVAVAFFVVIAVK